MITPFAPPNIGGAETHIELLWEYLLRRGYCITVLTYQPLTTNVRGLALERKEGLTIRRFSWFGHHLPPTFAQDHPIANFLYITPYLFVRSVVFMVFHRKEVDAIHVFGLNAGMIGRVLKLLFRKRVVMSVKGIFGFRGYTFLATLTHWVLKGLDVILVGSLDSKEDFLNVGISPKRLTLYTHWIDHEHFKPGSKPDMKRKIGWENAFTVVYSGRLIPQKGVEVLIQSARIMPRVQFKVIGDGVLRERMVRAAKELPNLEFIGRMHHRDVAPYVAAADLLIYPVRYHEDVSLSLLEALACGTPVMSSDRGSGVYRLNDGVSIVTAPTAERIKEKIEWLQGHPDLLAEMSRNAVKFAAEFTPRLAETIVTAYS